LLRIGLLNDCALPLPLPLPLSLLRIASVVYSSLTRLASSCNGHSVIITSFGVGDGDVDAAVATVGAAAGSAACATSAYFIIIT
jgi:hypothetical protein